MCTHSLPSLCSVSLLFILYCFWSVRDFGRLSNTAGYVTVQLSVCGWRYSCLISVGGLSWWKGRRSLTSLSSSLMDFVSPLLLGNWLDCQCLWLMAVFRHACGPLNKESVRVDLHSPEPPAALFVTVQHGGCRLDSHGPEPQTCSEWSCILVPQ